MEVTLHAPERDVAQANAYAVAYRLIGNRVDALAVADRVADEVQTIATSGVPVDWHTLWSGDLPADTQHFSDTHDSNRFGSESHARTFGGSSSPIAWLTVVALRSVEYGLNQPIQSHATLDSSSDSESAQHVMSLRSAVRRRLENSTAEERIAGALVHLSGYPVEFAARAMNVSQDQLLEWSNVLAPPPNMSYRQLGDPDKTHEDQFFDARQPWWRRHMFTIAVAIVVLIAAFWMTRLSGERPSFGPELDQDTVIVTDNGPVTDYLPPDDFGSNDTPIDPSSVTD